MNRICIGMSGWTYPPWRGVFYPAGWPQKRELEFASRQVNAIEINGTFYSLQKPASFRSWYRATPDGFTFTVKGGRYITHIRRLKEVAVPLANFFASGILCLKEKLGPILWQLPPSFRFDPGRLEDFFRLLPRDMKEASRLARRHDGKLHARAALKVESNLRIRHALEIRHASFESMAFIDLLREHEIALVVADTAGKWPLMEDMTSDFTYLRLHGDEELYLSGYTDEALVKWAAKIRSWTRGKEPADSHCISPKSARTKSPRDVYAFFDNDVKVRAPFDAMALAYRLGIAGAPLAFPTHRVVSGKLRRQWPEVPRVWRQA